MFIYAKIQFTYTLSTENNRKGSSNEADERSGMIIKVQSGRPCPRSPEVILLAPGRKTAKQEALGGSKSLPVIQGPPAVPLQFSKRLHLLLLTCFHQTKDKFE